VFELVEEAFDQIALAIDCGIDAALVFSVARRWDVGGRPCLSDESEDGIAVIGAVTDDFGACGQAAQQGRDRARVMNLAGGEDQADGQASLVDQRIDLGAQSATRTADGVIRTPLLPPAAC